MENKTKVLCGLELTFDKIMEYNRGVMKKIMLDTWGDETPHTSWDNVLDNLIETFKLYCGDEASNFMEEQFMNDSISITDVMAEFGMWVLWADMEDFDV